MVIDNHDHTGGQIEVAGEVTGFGGQADVGSPMSSANQLSKYLDGAGSPRIDQSQTSPREQVVGNSDCLRPDRPLNREVHTRDGLQSARSRRQRNRAVRQIEIEVENADLRNSLPNSRLCRQLREPFTAPLPRRMLQSRRRA